MTIELSAAEQGLLDRIITSYLSELRQTIAATQTGTSSLHVEEEMVKSIQKKVQKTT